MNGIVTILADAIPVGTHWLEQISWGATVVLAIAALIALYQVRAAIKQAKCALDQNKIAIEQLKVMGDQLEISKTDIVLRSKREAIAVALDQCKRFAEQIVPHLDKTNKALMAKNYTDLPTNVDSDFPFITKEIDALGAQIWVSDIELRKEIVNTVNELESFAMYFACGLADEGIAFTPTAVVFCQSCEYYRLFIGVFRQPEKMKLYQNLVKLYGMWKPRLERTVLEEQAKLLEAKKQKLPTDKKVSPIGTVL